MDDSRIHLAQSADLFRLREDLIDFIWGEAGFPVNALPATVTTNVASPLPGGDTAARVDRLDIVIEGGFASIAYFLWPTAPVGKLAIFHQGHSDILGGGGGDSTVAFFLERGWAVVALTMDAQGAIVATEGSTATRIPAVVSSLVDPTGAGDSFSAGFLAEWVLSGDAVKAASAGVHLAAKAVAQIGARAPQ